MMEKELYKSVNDGVMYCTIFNPVALPSLSMAYTTPAWVNEAKTVTRRDWSSITLRKYRNETYYLAVSRQKRFGGEALGIGRLTADPFKQSTGEIRGDGDYIAEGFEYLDERYVEILPEEGMPLVRAMIRWIDADIPKTVVQFKPLEVFPGMKEKYSTDEEIIRCVKALLKELP